jgi:predicted kinase
MARLWLLCGLAFAGKTTLGRPLAERRGAVWISLDEINRERGVGHGGDGLAPEVWAATLEQALEHAGQALAAGREGVVDDTSPWRWIRDRYRELAARHGAALVLVWLDTPLATVQARRRRNDRLRRRRPVRDPVFEDHRAGFEPPGADEDAVRVRPGDSVETVIERGLSRPSPPPTPPPAAAPAGPRRCGSRAGGSPGTSLRGR